MKELMHVYMNELFTIAAWYRNLSQIVEAVESFVNNDEETWGLQYIHVILKAF